MKVKQLIKNLLDCNMDADVIIKNDDIYVSGDYIATHISKNDDEVIIESDYERMVTEYD